MSLSVRIRHAFPAFKLDVAFEAPDGITAIFGASGSGKTTTIKAIAGLLRPRAGKVTLGGETLLDTDSGIDVAPYHRRIGVVFQEPRLFSTSQRLAEPALRMAALAAASRQARRGSDHRDACAAAASSSRPVEAFGGERQRVAVGRALLASPRLLLLDEPLTGLDRPLREELLPYLERLRDEARVPILYVSHSVDEVARLADNVVVLAGGKVAAQGSVFEVFARPELDALVGDQSGAVVDAVVTSHLAGRRVDRPRPRRQPASRAAPRCAGRERTFAYVSSPAT